jgi:shikimate dehydrogenase
MRKFGIIGHPLAHSFSPKWFAEKFKKEGLNDCRYTAYDLPDINQLPLLLHNLGEELAGLNVTIPYKESVMDFLAGIDKEAAEIGSVNVLKNLPEGWFGFNTDVYGFRQSIGPFLRTEHERALILGTGGSSKSIDYVLKSIGISTVFVSREAKSATNTISYHDLRPESVRHFKLIINTTPLGTWPEVDLLPPIPYEGIGENHLLYDLTYNPPQSKFLSEGAIRGAQTINGYNMLVMQAEKSWEIWNS